MRKGKKCYIEEDNKRMFATAFKLVWPAVLESLFTQIAGFVDSLMVSPLGAGAVAAIGLTIQPRAIVLALYMAVSVAISALIARRKGQGDREDANRLFVTMMFFVLISAVALSIVFILGADLVLKFMGSTEDTHGIAVEYFRIIIAGTVFNGIQMGINSAQRGAGNSRITMITNLVGNSANIFLNYLLIGGRLGFSAMGIRGAAIATVLGTVVASILSIISATWTTSYISFAYIWKNKILPSFKAFISLLHVGYSAYIEQVMMKVGFAFTAMLAARQGTNAMAAHQVGMNLMGLSFAFGDGLQAAAVALIGFSLGAGKPEEAKKYGSICQFIGRLISICIAVTWVIGARAIYGLFLDEAEIINYGVQIMYIMVLAVLVQVPQVITMGCLRGAGDTVYTAIVSVISAAFIRSMSSFFFCYVLKLGISGIWFGVFTDQLVRLMCATVRYRKDKWINIKI